MSGAPPAIAPAAAQRAAALASMLGRAMVDEPMMRWPLGAHGDPAARFTSVFGWFIGPAIGRGIVREAGPALGAAVWIPPERFAEPAEDPWSQPLIATVTDDGGRRYREFWEWIDSRLPREPLWQLDTIAVDPARQGRGVGRALIADGLERAGADRTGVFLSTGTARNVAIYERCGFEVVERLPAPSGGPQIWFMRWEP